VRVQKSARSDAVPEVDEQYIPPLLACDAWPTLQAGILQYFYDRLGKKIDLRARQVVGGGIGLDSHAQGDALILARLRIYNEAYAVLAQLAFLKGIHPQTGYVELCRLVGELAIFGETRRTPDLPLYDHDDLGGCFFRLKQYLDDLLETDKDPEYKEVPFVGMGLRMQVAIESMWLEQGWSMFVGVVSQLEPKRCVEILTNESQLGMKIGSGERADEIYRRGEAGLRFAPESAPPRALPGRPGLIYFRVIRESQEDEWKNVQKTLSMAIRVNEHRVEGGSQGLQGKQVLTIKPGGGQTSTLQFTLYVVPPGK
jgi:type VI secretion system protein ImpJ